MLEEGREEEGCGGRRGGDGGVAVRACGQAVSLGWIPACAVGGGPNWDTPKTGSGDALLYANAR